MHARRWEFCAFFLLLLSLSCSAPVSDEADSSEPPAADEAAAVADAGDKISAEEAAGDAADATPPEPAKEPDKPKPEPVKMDKPPRPMKGPNPALRNPSLASGKAPATFKAKFETTKGSFVVEVTRKWSPRGADRFYNLVKIGYFRNIAFFRVIEGFMAQFGMHGDPAIGQKWSAANIQDDPVVTSNQRGYVSFAKTNMPHSRSVQFFINYKDNGSLDSIGFSPFGRVIEGMEVVDSVYKGYGEGPPSGRGPGQGRIRAEGNSYLKRDFPKLDYIKKATLLN
jgi:peptidyl-prolyl cis-trans isomerase A (cyclophilin A)